MPDSGSVSNLFRSHVHGYCCKHRLSGRVDMNGGYSRIVGWNKRRSLGVPVLL
jgi:hypothetical protein